jgi:phytanoyl-CoA hydroxylase
MLLGDAHAVDLAEPLRHFAEHGWARLGRVLDDAGLTALRARADAIMLGEVVYPGLFFQIDSGSGRYEDLTYGKGWEGPSLRYRKVEKLEKDPLFRAWLENALFERIARALVPWDGDGAAIYRAVLFNKCREGGSALPWHQDGGRFWGLDRDPELQIWTALDDAGPDAGCVEVVSGSHHRGLATPLGGVVPNDHVLSRGAEEAARPVPALAGEALLIHNHLWHRSGLNRSGKPRRAFTVCYMSAATRCLRKKRAPRDFTRVWSAK